MRPFFAALTEEDNESADASSKKHYLPKLRTSHKSLFGLQYMKVNEPKGDPHLEKDGVIYLASSNYISHNQQPFSPSFSCQEQQSFIFPTTSKKDLKNGNDYNPPKKSNDPESRSISPSCTFDNNIDKYAAATNSLSFSSVESRHGVSFIFDPEDNFNLIIDNEKRDRGEDKGVATTQREENDRYRINNTLVNITSSVLRDDGDFGFNNIGGLSSLHFHACHVNSGANTTMEYISENFNVVNGIKKNGNRQPVATICTDAFSRRVSKTPVEYTPPGKMDNLDKYENVDDELVTFDFGDDNTTNEAVSEPSLTYVSEKIEKNEYEKPVATICTDNAGVFNTLECVTATTDEFVIGDTVDDDERVVMVNNFVLKDTGNDERVKVDDFIPKDTFADEHTKKNDQQMDCSPTSVLSFMRKRMSEVGLPTATTAHEQFGYENTTHDEQPNNQAASVPIFKGKKLSVDNQTAAEHDEHHDSIFEYDIDVGSADSQSSPIGMELLQLHEAFVSQQSSFLSSNETKADWQSEPFYAMDCVKEKDDEVGVTTCEVPLFDGDLEEETASDNSIQPNINGRDAAVFKENSPTNRELLETKLRSIDGTDDFDGSIEVAAASDKSKFILRQEQVERNDGNQVTEEIYREEKEETEEEEDEKEAQKAVVLIVEEEEEEDITVSKPHNKKTSTMEKLKSKKAKFVSLVKEQGKMMKPFNFMRKLKVSTLSRDSTKEENDVKREGQNYAEKQQCVKGEKNRDLVLTSEEATSPLHSSCPSYRSILQDLSEGSTADSHVSPEMEEKAEDRDEHDEEEETCHPKEEYIENIKEEEEGARNRNEKVVFGTVTEDGKQDIHGSSNNFETALEKFSKPNLTKGIQQVHELEGVHTPSFMATEMGVERQLSLSSASSLQLISTIEEDPQDLNTHCRNGPIGANDSSVIARNSDLCENSDVVELGLKRGSNDSASIQMQDRCIFFNANKPKEERRKEPEDMHEGSREDESLDQDLVDDVKTIVKNLSDGKHKHLLSSDQANEVAQTSSQEQKPRSTFDDIEDINNSISEETTTSCADQRNEAPGTTKSQGEETDHFAHVMLHIERYSKHTGISRAIIVEQIRKELLKDVESHGSYSWADIQTAQSDPNTFDEGFTEETTVASHEDSRSINISEPVRVIFCSKQDQAEDDHVYHLESILNSGTLEDIPEVCSISGSSSSSDALEY